jgi:hypothetical protein
MLDTRFCLLGHPSASASWFGGWFLPWPVQGIESLDHVQGVRNLNEGDDRTSHHLCISTDLSSSMLDLAAVVLSLNKDLKVRRLWLLVLKLLSA